MKYAHLGLLKNFVERGENPPEFQLWLCRALQECWQKGRSLDECLGIPKAKDLCLTRAIFICGEGRDLDFKSSEIAQDIADAIKIFESHYWHIDRDNLTPLFRAIYDAEKSPGVTPKNWRRLHEKFFD
ncbi:MAG: hypothetical protein AB7U63_09150 [Porticoccaceae bacterium]